MPKPISYKLMLVVLVITLTSCANYSREVNELSTRLNSIETALTKIVEIADNPEVKRLAEQAITDVRVARTVLTRIYDLTLQSQDITESAKSAILTIITSALAASTR